MGTNILTGWKVFSISEEDKLWDDLVTKDGYDDKFMSLYEAADDWLTKNIKGDFAIFIEEVEDSIVNGEVYVKEKADAETIEKAWGHKP